MTQTKKPPASALQQKGEFETRRKLDMVLEWLELQTRMRAQAGACGRLQIEIIWEKGAIKRAKFVDEIVIEDLTDKERELVLRASAGQPTERA